MVPNTYICSFLFLFKAKYFEDEPELTFDEIIEQVQGTDLPVETKDWLREVSCILCCVCFCCAVLLLTNVKFVGHAYFLVVTAMNHYCGS